MTKTVCDITGTVPATNYRLVRPDGITVLALDLCDTCADNIVDLLRNKRMLGDMQAIMKDGKIVPAPVDNQSQTNVP